MNWIDFYMGLAFAVARKSPDIESKHGCFLVDPKNRPLGFGFNGFPREADSIGLPVTRPDKYMWMYHSERNAIANCEHRPEGATCYITGECCNDCLYALWQSGVKKVIYADRDSAMLNQEIRDWTTEFLRRTGMEYIKVRPKLSWLQELSNNVEDLGFTT